MDILIQKIYNNNPELTTYTAKIDFTKKEVSVGEFIAFLLHNFPDIELSVININKSK